MQMKRETFTFSDKGNLILMVNLIRGHASLLLVLKKCFRGDKTILIRNKFEHLQL